MIKFTIDDKIFTLSEEIETVCLFGSAARGDSDKFSDLDILIIIKDCEEEDYYKKKRNIEKQLELPSGWISLYKKSTILDLHKYGSYFLWHVKNEGKILYSKSGFLEDVLHSIKEYTKVDRDLIEYKIICSDIRKSVEFDSSTMYYELSILASLVRNTCITICYLNNKMVFGRIAAVKTCMAIAGDKFPFSIDEYIELYNFRIGYTRNYVLVYPFIPDKVYVNKWLDNVELLLEIAYQIKKG